MTVRPIGAAVVLCLTMQFATGCSPSDPYDARYVDVHVTPNRATPEALTISVTAATCRELESQAERHGDEIRIEVKRHGKCRVSMNMFDPLVGEATAQTEMSLPPGDYRITVTDREKTDFMHWDDGLVATGASPAEAQSAHAVVERQRELTSSAAASIEHAVPQRKLLDCGQDTGTASTIAVRDDAVQYSCKLQKPGADQPFLRVIPYAKVQAALGCKLTPALGQIWKGQREGEVHCTTTVLDTQADVYVIVREEYVEVVVTGPNGQRLGPT